jgi:hypothetical protein
MKSEGNEIVDSMADLGKSIEGKMDKVATHLTRTKKDDIKLK